MKNLLSRGIYGMFKRISIFAYADELLQCTVVQDNECL